MKTSQKETLYICGCCKLSLPLSVFYVNKNTGLRDNYCKECRKSASRERRERNKRSLVCDKRPDYPVITATEDPVLRHELILRALATVAASIERKKRKLREAEFLSETDGMEEPETDTDRAERTF